jgi:hypothetical protein
MPDEWGQFKDADEYAHFRDAPENNGQKRDSISLGVLKGILPAAENVAPYTPANLIPGFREKNAASLARLRQHIAEREQIQKPNPWAQTAATIEASVPTFAIKNPFAQGAAMGWLNSEAQSPEGRAMDMATGAGLNVVGGKAVDAIADVFSPVIEPAVRRLAEAGVRLTPGMKQGGKAMIREDKLVSRPVVGDAVTAARQGTQDSFNSTAVNKALEPLGVKVPLVIKPGYDQIGFAKDTIGREYDRIVPNLAVTVNPQSFVQNVGPKFSALGKAQQDEVINILNEHLKNGQLSGQALKDAQGELRRLAAQYSRSPVVAERRIGQTLWDADGELSNAMMAQNPKWAPDLQKANEAYRGYRIIADAAGRADDGAFNTAQLKAAVRRGDRSSNKDASARGQAFMQEFSNDARSVIPQRVPNSGTADRMPMNPFALAGGVKDAALYNANDLWQQLRMLPRPAAMQTFGGAVRGVKAPLTYGIVAAGQQPDN